MGSGGVEEEGRTGTDGKGKGSREDPVSPDERRVFTSSSISMKSSVCTGSSNLAVASFRSAFYPLRLPL